MRKKLDMRVLIAILAAAVVAVSVWNLFYHNRKSIDNLPAKELLVTVYQEKGEAEALSQLEGYTVEQISTVWGASEAGLFGMRGEIWTTDFHTITVYFDGEKRAEALRVDPRTWMFRAKIIEVTGTQFLVEPLEGTPERESYDRIYVPMEQMDASVEPEVGDVIKIEYDGMVQELYPAVIPGVSHISVVSEAE